ncbi:hypothetical protein [Bacillus haynesii]|nr:hypothetical protein [Bacillus haynesii]MCY7793195.1 hypothetical protein [Bacillus haynesii]
MLFELLFEKVFKKGWKCALLNSKEKIFLFDPKEKYMVVIPSSELKLLLEKLDEFNSLNKLTYILKNKGLFYGKKTFSFF